MPQITPQDLTPTIDEPAHDLRSYVYRTTNDSDAVGIEYGVMDYTQGNVEYLFSLFGEGRFAFPATFSYYNFTIRDFLSPRVSNHDLSESSHNYSLEFQYNYYMQDYENLAAQVHESSLPSHYVLRYNNEMLSVLGSAPTSFVYRDDINEEAAFSLSNVGSTVNPYIYTLNAEKDLYRDLGGTNFAYDPSNYYHRYVNNIGSYMETDDYEDFKDKTRYCFMSFNRRVEKSNAPMYSKMRVNYKKSKSDDPLNQSANDTFESAVKHSRPYIYYFYHHLHSATPTEKSLNTIQRAYSIGYQFNEYGINPLEIGEDLVTTPLKIYPSLGYWVYRSAPDAFLGYSEMPLFDNMNYAPVVEFEHDSLHFLNSLFPNIEAANPKVKELFEKVNWSVTQPGLGKFIEGNPTYNPSIVCFKIEKYSGTSTVPVQTYFIDHDWSQSSYGSDYSFFEFLDTQLAYGAKYRYKVFAICRIATPTVQVMDAYYVDGDGKTTRMYKDSVRSESSVVPTVLEDWLYYQASLGISSDNLFNKIYIKTSTTTKAEFLEIEIFEDSIDAIEPIYCEPEAKFYNQDGKQNDLLVRAELNFNGAPEPYIPITPEDEENIEQYLQYFNSNGTYDFQTMNGGGRFEIRRLSTPPEKYTDFANAYSEVFTDIIGSGPISSVAAFNINKIIPNRKYYYILRSINNHGVFSNPTPVFQVELFQDSDDTFIIVNEYMFKNNLRNNYSKSGKRYFQLKVSNLQGLINEQTLEFQNASTAEEVRNVQLGPENLRNNLWGKTFKIRLTSEKTGKKIDFNVSFKHTDEPS